MTDEASTGTSMRIIQQAESIRIECAKRGLAIEEIANRIRQALPEVSSLRSWRLAAGWALDEVCDRLIALYREKGSSTRTADRSVVSQWESGEQQPDDENIEYLCELFHTYPDRLGFGSRQDVGHINHVERAGIIDAYPYTSNESEADLMDRILAARHRITMFGLTRNFYVRKEPLRVFEEKSKFVPIKIYVMHPFCESRRDRYRVEPTEARMENPGKYVADVLRPLAAAAERQPGLKIFTYNFPCSFAMEEIDDVVRVMLYGHGKLGTQGPIITFTKGGSPYSYFVEQLNWLQRLAEGNLPDPWASKGVEVCELDMSAIQ